MSMSRFKVGDLVRVKMCADMFNGLTGHIIHKDGDYIYVNVTVDGETVPIEVYSCEIDRIHDFPEELFEL